MMSNLALPALNILLIDDDDVATEGVIRSLRKVPMECGIFTAQDGLDGLEILRGQTPEKSIPSPFLVLLDLNMPRMDGLEFLAELRADENLHRTVVFVLTTSSRDTDRAAAYQQHIAGYMVKSDVGPQFSKLAELLRSYRQSIILPASHAPPK
jgi:CheY-like chemotaxis protein